MIEPDWARCFAADWIDAWNAGDLSRFLVRCADNFGKRSPLIVERLGEPSGRLHGKSTVADYPRPGLAAHPRLTFELLVLVGVDSVAI